MAAVYHKGENIVLCSGVARPIYGEIDLDEYDVKVYITDFYGKRVLSLPEDDPEMLEVEADTDSIYLFIPGQITDGWRGIYFCSVELWYNGQKLVSNELGNIEIIE